MGRSNLLFENTVTKTNRSPVTTSISNNGTNNAAIIYNPQEDQYELVANVRAGFDIVLIDN